MLNRYFRCDGVIRARITALVVVEVELRDHLSLSVEGREELAGRACHLARSLGAPNHTLWSVNLLTAPPLPSRWRT